MPQCVYKATSPVPLETEGNCCEQTGQRDQTNILERDEMRMALNSQDRRRESTRVPGRPRG